MTKFFMAIVVCSSLTCICYAQHGTAKSGYYPANFFGDTWSGKLESVNDTTREMTLSYTKGHKTKKFVGVVESGYIAHTSDGQDVPLKLSLIPLGMHLTVYYTTETEKKQGKKVKVHAIFKIAEIPNVKPGKLILKAF